ncbi:iron ABC transporter permease [Shimazuella sp. AN120528]|uniref:FecCD family ABC transporter permease n=1 Tax=Shimazuella soli TaxID=1892854 RepID=UPI001F0FD5BE|nr:iron ABC transporter permease [Shimazuella soli]MCH5585698.1 iron ABC transporter permease [Shimazuella soli]
MKKYVWIILCLILFCLVVISVGVGEAYISPLHVVKSFLGLGNPFDSLIIFQLRLPRIVLATLAGMAFAVAGCILQAITRNPMATPEMMGISGGASVAAVSIIMIFSTQNDALSISLNFLPLFAFLGATLVALLIYLFAWKKGVSSLRLVLVGIGFYILMNALVNLIVLIGPLFRAMQAKTWLTGSIYGTTWKEVMVLLPWLAVLLPIAYLFSRSLTIHELGENTAIGLGMKIKTERFFLLILCTSLTGAAVAFVGGITFIGLIGPHLARRLVGNDYRFILPVAALIGAIMVVGADLIGHTLLAPKEIPAGVFTALIGVPYFLYLIYRSKGKVSS